MLLWHNPPSTGSNWTLGHCVVAGCVGAVWMHVESCGAVMFGRSSKGRCTWCLTALFVMRGELPGMLLQVYRECVHFVTCSACLVVELGGNMMGRHQSYVQAWKVVKACILLALPLQASPFVRAPFVQAPFVHGGGHTAPVADLLVGGSIHAWGE